MNTHGVHLCLVQVYMADDEKSPRCLHQWNPHDGKPLSALFFLDNHKHHSPEYVRHVHLSVVIIVNVQVFVVIRKYWVCSLLLVIE